MANKKILGWDAEPAEIPLYPNCDLVFTLDPKTATGNAITTWPTGATSTLYFYRGDPTANGTQILTAAGIVDPNGIEFVIQSDVLDPIRATATHFLLITSMPESPTQEFPTYYGKVVKRVAR